MLIPFDLLLFGSLLKIGEILLLSNTYMPVNKAKLSGPIEIVDVSPQKGWRGIRLINFYMDSERPIAKVLY